MNVKVYEVTFRFVDFNGVECEGTLQTSAVSKHEVMKQMENVLEREVRIISVKHL
jgi:hypothetical protein